MNFANLVGMYKVALNRCIDVIACNEENSSVEEIIDAVDCTLTMIDGNEDLLALLTLDDTYRLILYKYHRILCLMRDIEKDIKKYDFKNHCYFDQNETQGV